MNNIQSTCPSQHLLPRMEYTFHSSFKCLKIYLSRFGREEEVKKYNYNK